MRAPTTDSRRSPAERRRGGARKPSRGRRILLITLVTVASLLAVLVVGAGWIYSRLDAGINTFDEKGIDRQRPAATFAGQNILVIGSDSRSGKNSRLGGGKGDVGRSDTAFLLHVYADRKHAVAVSIPRDTLVDIPRCRLPDGTWTRPQSNVMFNTAFTLGLTAKGNPACTQNTVEKLTGLRVDHTVVVDFQGFSAMTRAVGGVRVCLPKDVYEGDLDPNLGSRGRLLFTKGRQTVAGVKALNYVRIRHGIGDGSDIGRIQRQQAFLSSLIRKVKAQGLNPATLLPLVEAAAGSMTFDPGLGSADKLLSFAMSMKDIDLRDTKFVTLPWRYQGARVAIVQSEAHALWAALRADRTIDGVDASGKARPSGLPSPTPAAAVSGTGISVTVYNGTTVTGLAARAADRLTTAGFTVTRVATADSQNHAATLIEYGPGQAERARTVARMFAGATFRRVTDPGVAVILGRSYVRTPDPGAATPVALPTSVAGRARSAADDACSNLSYG
ncbi:LCP family protein [Microtetraspora sp. AC03309]|uniref:LCP family protein n=1 Tax=Microtetraspora sp. AC03309 TaxID=2779376 RepID=UPI001E5A0EF7|nr:LCP family protein [Microtetraspora sp. AC03309]MCC5574333.1 LCP family protein [Microtetraspora sp. AC03309]